MTEPKENQEQTKIPRLSSHLRLMVPSSVKNRIIFGFGLLIVVLAIVVIGSASLWRTHLTVLEELKGYDTLTSHLQAARVEGASASMLLHRYVMTGDQGDLVALSSLQSNDSFALAATYKHLFDEEQRITFETINDGKSSLAPVVQDIIALRQIGDVQGAETLLEQVAPSFEQYGIALVGLTESIDRKTATLREQAEDTPNSALRLLIIPGTIGIVLARGTSILVAHSILRPLWASQSNALAIANGNQVARATTTSPEELARLAESFNEMVDSLQKQALELRQSQERYHSIIETAYDAFISIDHAGYITDWNAQAEATFGWTRPEVIGRPLAEIIIPLAFRDAHQKGLQRFLATGEGPVLNKRIELTALHRNGHEFPVELTIWSTKEGQDFCFHAFVHDISERKAAEEELRQANEELSESEERYRSAIETANDAFISLDDNGLICEWNAQAERTFGWRREEVLGRLLANVIMPERFRKEHQERFQRFLASGQSVVLNTRSERPALHKDGHEFPVEITVWSTQSGQRRRSNLFARDISERKKAEEQLKSANEELQRLYNEARDRANRDSVTGLYNHRYFHGRIRGEVSQVEKRGKKLGLIVLDIDGFKAVNDSFGHQMGDRVLKRLATAMKDTVGDALLFRVGGDEFAVLLIGVENGALATVSERLRSAIANHSEPKAPKVTVSLGVAIFPDSAKSADELIYGADMAMYWAKASGKNRIVDWGKLVFPRTGMSWYGAERATKSPEVVAALVNALAAKDPYMACHAMRCPWYSLKLAEELGLDAPETSVVQLASLLHDIGKLAIRDEVLFKSGELTEDEWEHMKQHPTAGLHILGNIKSLSDVCPAVLHHHEHFDGSGYPDGLAGNDIPVASRIVLVADAFDAMTTDRPYRKAMSVKMALEELKRNSGSQFDPKVVEAFLNVLAKHGPYPTDTNKERNVDIAIASSLPTAP